MGVFEDQCVFSFKKHNNSVVVCCYICSLLLLFAMISVLADVVVVCNDAVVCCFILLLLCLRPNEFFLALMSKISRLKLKRAPSTHTIKEVLQTL